MISKNEDFDYFIIGKLNTILFQDFYYKPAFNNKIHMRICSIILIISYKQFQRIQKK